MTDDTDPYLWLEDVEGEDALAWVEERNSESLAVLENLPQYGMFYDKNLAVYDSEDRIPNPAIRGDYLYNFWRDATNERGLWRRTSYEEYAKDDPKWEVLLDLDKLAEEEKEKMNAHPASGQRYELYDLNADPSEANNVADAHPERVQSMAVMLEGIKAGPGSADWTAAHFDSQ